MIDRRQILCELDIADFAATPIERGRLAVELRRRPQTSPDTRCGSTLEQDRKRRLLTRLRDQQNGLARLAPAALLAAGKLRLTSVARGDANCTHWTDRTSGPNARAYGRSQI